MDLRGRNILVFGSGISGVSASRLLLAKGAEVILYDGNISLDAEKIKNEILEDRKGKLQVILGKLPAEIVDSLALTIMSPGVPPDIPAVNQMRAKGVPIWGDQRENYHHNTVGRNYKEL